MSYEPTYITVPMPYGQLTPSLEGSYNYNSPRCPEWLRSLCPSCGSDNVCILDPLFNSDIETNLGRSFCISCYESWRYEEDD